MGAEHAARRIPWACRRGLLELDLWLAPLARRSVDLGAEDSARCLELLAESDRELLAWLEGRAQAPREFRPLIEFIRKGCAA